jgi:hypothetical protein
MSIMVLWVATPCSLVGALMIIALIMEAASTSETSANFYQTTRRNFPEESRLHL